MRLRLQLDAGWSMISGMARVRLTPLYAASLALGCFAFETPASQAQVLEIGPAGAVTRHDGPAVYDDAGSRPIEAPRPPVAAVRRFVAEGGAPLTRAADAASLSPALVAAVAWAESRFRAGAISRAGAIGEMQLTPGTARALGVDPHDTAQNYRGGAAYLRMLLARYDGDLVRTLAAYNAGPAAVDRWAGVPPYPETRAYVAAVLERLSLRASAGD